MSIKSPTRFYRDRMLRTFRKKPAPAPQQPKEQQPAPKPKPKPADPGDRR